MSKYKYSVKALALFLAVAVMAGGMPVSALAATNESTVEANQADVSGTDWGINGTALTIETDAGMSDWLSESTIVQKKSIESIVITAGVSYIGVSAFEGCSSLTSIEIPKSVSNINGRAFADCSSLTSIDIPEGVSNIEVGVFLNCNGLIEINVNSNNTKYYSKEGILYQKNTEILLAYPSGKTATTFTVPSNVKGIAGYAFSYCSRLLSIEIPEGVSSMGGSVFANCSSLAEINVSSNNTNYYSKEGVLYSKDSDVLLAYPSGKAAIKFTVPSSVNFIEMAAFEGCSSLTSIEIPEAVSYIEMGVFMNCSGLTEINVSSNNINYYSKEGILYNKSTEILLVYPSGKTATKFTIPSSVNMIEMLAFSGCSSLSRIEIPENVKSIGDAAFIGCSSLTEVTFLSATPPSIGNYLLESCNKLTAIYVPAANVADYKAVTNLSGYTDLIQAIIDSHEMEWEITGTTLTIETDEGLSDWPRESTVEQKQSIESVVIKEGVSCIGYGVFEGCNRLASIEVPASVSSIERGAFANCNGLTEINVNSNNTNYYSKEGVLYQKITEILLIYPSGKTATKFTVPSNVNRIEFSAFSDCGSLISIEIPEGVSSIGEGAFVNCSDLTEINVNSNNTNYYSMEGILYQKNAEMLLVYPAGKTATKYTIPNRVNRIGAYAFCFGSSLTNIKIPEGVSSIGEGAFGYCISLTNIEIPEGVSSIGGSAFYGCSSLTEVTFLSTTPPNIGGFPFYSCDKLTAIYVAAANAADYKAVTNLREYSDSIQAIINSYVTVYKGSGSGVYNKNATVTIEADPDTKEQVFQSWSSTDEIEFADTTNRTTTFTMPENDVTITANYVRFYPVNMQNGSTSKNYYKEGDTVTITASTVEGQEFTGWTTKDGITLVNAGSLQTTFIMPAKPVTITANYKVSKVEITGITVSQTNASLKVKESLTLKASVTPSNATDPSVTWSSSNTDIAIVDVNGTVTGKGIGSAIITATSKSNTVLTSACTINVSIGKVTGLTAKKNKTTSITLTWEAQNNVDGYQVYRFDSAKKKYVNIATIKKHSTVTYTDKKRSVATTYQYKVRAYVTIGKKTKYGSYSSILKTATVSKNPTLSIKAGSKKATLTWGKISKVSGYEIYMSTKKKSGYSKIKTVNSKTTKYIKKKLKKGKTYYFKIRTYKKVNGVNIYSSYSSVKKVKVK